MPFIGNQPALSYTSFAKQDFTTSATTSYTLDNPVTNENEIALFINFVRQEPTTAYTATGTSLTLTSATSASDDMYCVFLGKAVQTVNPPSGSVGTAQIADLAVTSGKLASGVLPDNTPAFEAYLSSSQVINDNTNTKIQFDTEVYDTDNCYDNSTNYRFTPTTAGKYFIYSQLYLDSTAGNMRQVTSKIYKNGGELVFTNVNFDNNYGEGAAVTQSAVVDLNGSSDYIEIFGNPDTVDNGTAGVNGGASERFSLFGAYRIIT
jgi:hypothetical protein